MNQIASCVRIRLLDLTNTSLPFGNAEGRAVFRALADQADARSQPTIFEISLEGIEATDASFPRESVISAAKFYRGQHWFCLTNVQDRDIIDNWKYAAQAKEQPLVIWHSDADFEVIGPELTPATNDLLDYVLKNGRVGTNQVAADLGISVPNASTRLKRLVSDGYLLRQEETADSGGVEFMYIPIKCTD